MKYKIKQENRTTTIFDNKGNKIYYEDSDGYWRKSKFDNKGNEIYWEGSDGFWVKRKFDNKGNKIYYEDSNGYWGKSKYDNKGNEIYYEDSNGNKWEAEKPKPKKDKIFIAKDLNNCLKKLKENLK